ncbi:hypothetical protein CAC42_3713 [Sphaceloma murrayae]|uniref:Uncharacterized protein n=1 Tax=Sphaceloma murrayae TaxID=2082308 RepID=A0A2K1QGY5_9PEZI|nr:hypothetical protein CAC42_3713 [Sphaceloma murrayae]
MYRSETVQSSTSITSPSPLVRGSIGPTPLPCRDQGVIDPGLINDSCSSHSSDFSDVTITNDDGVSPRSVAVYPSPLFNQDIPWSAPTTSTFTYPTHPITQQQTGSMYVPDISNKNLEPALLYSGALCPPPEPLSSWDDSHGRPYALQPVTSFQLPDLASMTHHHDPIHLGVHLEDVIQDNINVAGPPLLPKPSNTTQPQFLSASPTQGPRTRTSSKLSTYPSGQMIILEEGTPVKEEADKGVASHPPRFGIKCDSSRMSGAERKRRDDLLMKLRRQNLTYKQIKEQGGFAEHESTLRGRVRILMKPGVARVRKPEWTEEDIRILSAIVEERYAVAAQEKVEKSRRAQGRRCPYVKYPWTKIAEAVYAAGSSYPYGPSSCSKMAAELGLPGVALGRGQARRDKS